MKAAIYIRVSTKEQKQIFDQAGILPHIQTPRGGFHYWFRYPGYYVKTLAGLLPGVDIRGDGGFVNVIGKRRDGEYKCLIVPIPENIYPWEKLPPVISEAIRANNNGHTQPFPVSTNTIPEGQRNQRLTQFAGAMRRQGMNEEAIETALQTTNKTQCNPPLPDDEVAGIVKSIMRYTPAPPP